MAHLLTLLLAALVTTSCAGREAEPVVPTDLLAQGREYVASIASRRAALERSVVSATNQYSALRLQKYAVPNGVWEQLPVASPSVRGLGSEEEVTDWSVVWTHDGLMRAGRRAFLNYPMRGDRRLEPMRAVTRETAGFWVAGDGRVGGLVEVGDRLAWTCSTCHARPAADGTIQPGVPNGQLDIAALYDIAGESNSLVAKWPIGTLDPSDDGTNNPSTVGDLRAVRYQTHLHWTGTLRNDLVALAVRIETLLIVSSGETHRPPRDLAFAVAYYLWHLSETPSDERSELYETNCGTCHGADGLTGGPLPWVETHPGRGTGFHRTPSLVGVTDRGRLLHDGSMDSLEQLLDAGPAWHQYGRHLDDEDRAELIGYITRHFGKLESGR